MTVAWLRRFSGRASTALSTSACDAPGSSGAGGGGAPRPPCANALVETDMTTRMNLAMHFIQGLQSIIHSNRARPERQQDNTSPGTRVSQEVIQDTTRVAWRSHHSSRENVSSLVG